MMKVDLDPVIVYLLVIMIREHFEQRNLAHSREKRICVREIVTMIINFGTKSHKFESDSSKQPRFSSLISQRKDPLEILL